MAFVGPQAGCSRAVESDEQGVIADAFAGDDISLIVRVRGNANAAALADRVIVKPAMFAENFAIRGAHNGPGMIGDVGREKIGHLHGPDKADALAIFFVGRRKVGSGRDPPQFGLRQMADRKAGEAQLCLRQEREEVGLILIFIEAFL